MPEEIRVHIHKQAEKESWDCQISPDVLGVVFAENWRQLRHTPGTRMRRLSSTPGYDFRLRIGAKTRAIASIAHDSEGRLSAYVHEVDRRATVYKRDKFDARLQSFWRNADGGPRQPNAEFIRNNYRYIDLMAAAPVATASDQREPASIHVLLQPEQQKFFNRVLPLLTPNGWNDAELVIGYGPPGSGKTLVACDLALEAFLDGYEVDVLVPSLGLEGEYTRALTSWGALASNTGGTARGVRVWRFPTFFAHAAGSTLRHDRESRLRAWWHEWLRQPSLKAAITQHVQSSQALSQRDLTERMPILIDALLEDEHFWTNADSRADAKDRMAGVFELFVSFLRKYRDSLFQHLESANHKDRNAIVTRAGLASPSDVANAPALACDTAEEPLRLMIVDEAQDLAPAEWRRLLDLWFPSQSAVGVRRKRLVLLGDLNQRVSLVPFHWKDVKEYAFSKRNLPPTHVVESQVDIASYRMRRNIGIFASGAFDDRVTGQRDMRSAGRIDHARLSEGGSVNVAVVDRERIDIAQVLAAGTPPALEGEYYFMIHGGTGDIADAVSRSDAILNSIRTAKGLEADRIVVVHPFAVRQARGPRPLTPDEASEYYTAVSRAREHVLLVIDEASRQLLARATDAWNVATVHPIGNDAERLRRLVEDCRIRLSPQEVRLELVRQLHRLCEQPDDGGGDVEKKISAIIARLGDIPDEDLPFELVEAGKLLSSTDTTVYEQVRKRAWQDLGAAKHARGVAFLLFAGETAMAARHAMRLPVSESGSWDANWLQTVAEDSCWQAWRAGREERDDDTTWTPHLLEGNVYGHTIDRIRDIRRALTEEERR